MAACAAGARAVLASHVARIVNRAVHGWSAVPHYVWALRALWTVKLGLELVHFGALLVHALINSLVYGYRLPS